MACCGKKDTDKEKVVQTVSYDKTKTMIKGRPVYLIKKRTRK